ncbi:hypothetical protein ElyMa_005461100 [Elysia marginata]|uniref:Secreted protein n=1 Tax=Elysia marginata TaxID=1093978 RepID=A0AAV4ENE6_9GAST|nr:hypothetical protein ElyMa_005461100 [Elysia marginata]
MTITITMTIIMTIIITMTIIIIMTIIITMTIIIHTNRQQSNSLTTSALLGDHHVVFVEAGASSELTLVVVGVGIVATDQPEHGFTLARADTPRLARSVHRARLHGTALHAHTRVVFWGWRRG